MTDAASQFDTIDRRLLDAVQQGVAMVERPFVELAERAGIDEATCLERLRSLRGHRRVIRQISAIFDTRALGYASSLVAARVEPRELERAAAVVNRHPGVSHNYQRDAAFNLWYTLAVPPDSALGLQGTMDVLHRESGAIATRALPTIRRYKIGVKFSFGVHDGSGSASFADRQASVDHALDESDRAMIRALQEDLPIEPRPFAGWAKQAGVSERELLGAARRYRDRRQMRRFAAVLHHRTAGMRANVMGVWRCDEDRADEMGGKLAAFDAVSHCYQRPTCDDWPYRLYTMVHAATPDEANTILRGMQRATGLADPRALWSVREFKKQRVRYFTGDNQAWEQAHRTTDPARSRGTG